MPTALETVKESNKIAKIFFAFSKWAVLHRKTAHFVRQNDSFCATKRPILTRKMSHFESGKNVKKTQVSCFQRFKTSAKFACTRPPDFNFRTMALSEAQNALFVHFFQHPAAFHRMRLRVLRKPCRQRRGIDSSRLFARQNTINSKIVLLLRRLFVTLHQITKRKTCKRKLRTRSSSSGT